jgi:NADH:ubiquinone oxidoreductase subunit 2 (subunit N)
MSVPVYVLVLLAFGPRPEAALKYLVLGGAATATFLLGVSLLYGAAARSRSPSSPPRWNRTRPWRSSPRP